MDAEAYAVLKKIEEHQGSISIYLGMVHSETDRIATALENIVELMVRQQRSTMWYLRNRTTIDPNRKEQHDPHDSVNVESVR